MAFQYAGNVNDSAVLLFCLVTRIRPTPPGKPADKIKQGVIGRRYIKGEMKLGGKDPFWYSERCMDRSIGCTSVLRYSCSSSH